MRVMHRHARFPNDNDMPQGVWSETGQLLGSHSVPHRDVLAGSFIL